MARHPAKDGDFVVVDRGLRRSNVPAAACLHFDKAESVTFPPHQVKIATDLSAAPVAGHNGISVAAQVKESCFLTPAPQLQVRRPASSETSSKVITGMNKFLEQAHRKHGPYSMPALNRSVAPVQHE